MIAREATWRASKLRSLILSTLKESYWAGRHRDRATHVFNETSDWIFVVVLVDRLPGFTGMGTTKTIVYSPHPFFISRH